MFKIPFFRRNPISEIERNDYYSITKKILNRFDSLPEGFVEDLICVKLNKTSSPDKLKFARYRKFQPYDNFKIDRDIVDYYFKSGLLDAKTRSELYVFFREEFNGHSPDIRQKSGGFYLGRDVLKESIEKSLIDAPDVKVFDNAKCPMCSSKNIQKRDMVIASGKSRTIGIGATSGGLALGIGQTRTALSKNADFDSGGIGFLGVILAFIVTSIFGFLGWIIGFLFDGFFGADVSIYFIIGLMILGGLGSIFFMSYVSNGYADEDRKKKWICMSCGAKF